MMLLLLLVVVVSWCGVSGGTVVWLRWRVATGVAATAAVAAAAVAVAFSSPFFATCLS